MNYDNQMDDYYESPRFYEMQRLEREKQLEELEERIKNESWV